MLKDDTVNVSSKQFEIKVLYLLLYVHIIMKMSIYLQDGLFG